jgi:Ran GTPase-activating protein (RanGAP) involved in mRNA processing and transport
LLIRSALLGNAQLTCLKLSYNQLGDEGCKIIAPAIRRHQSLKILDLGFNQIGDIGCEAISLSLKDNSTLETLYLGGNLIREHGAKCLALAIKNDSKLSCLHLTANDIGPRGVTALANAIAERNLVETENSKLASLDSTRHHEGGDHVVDCPANETKAHDPFMCNLFLGGTNMGSEGCSAISKMVLSHGHLQVLSLENNGLDDQDLLELSHSFSLKKPVNLQKLQLSFNKISCIGVEALMNAIWGAPSLREIKLDNNKVGDRGAQLAAVVMTSVELEVLDLGFNQITSTGVKALMKTVADNQRLRSLTLSGNALDTNSAKAISFALALNRWLQELYVDHCSFAFAAQRHITAGIVSNKQSTLSTVTGFSLGGELYHSFCC